MLVYCGLCPGFESLSFDCGIRINDDFALLQCYSFNSCLPFVTGVKKPPSAVAQVYGVSVARKPVAAVPAKYATQSGFHLFQKPFFYLMLVNPGSAKALFK